MAHLGLKLMKMLSRYPLNPPHLRKRKSTSKRRKTNPPRQNCFHSRKRRRQNVRRQNLVLRQNRMIQNRAQKLKRRNFRLDPTPPNPTISLRQCFHSSQNRQKMIRANQKLKRPAFSPSLIPVIFE